MNDAASVVQFGKPKGETVISRKIIRKPRKARMCEVCHNIIIGPQARLFGRAFPDDKPYVVYVHVNYHECWRA